MHPSNLCHKVNMANVPCGRRNVVVKDKFTQPKVLDNIVRLKNLVICLQNIVVINGYNDLKLRKRRLDYLLV